MMITIDQKKLYTWAVWSTVAIAGLGFIFNYMTLVLVAQDYGMNWLQVYIFPLLLDAFMIVAHLVFFFLLIRGQRAWLAGAVVVAAVALSVLFNLSHYFGWQVLGPVAWAFPPLAILGGVKLISQVVRVAASEQPTDESVQRLNAYTDELEHQNAELNATVQAAEGELEHLRQKVFNLEHSSPETEHDLNGLPPQAVDLFSDDTAAAVIAAKRLFPKLSQRSIAQMLNTSLGTVNNHLNNDNGKATN